MGSEPASVPFSGQWCLKCNVNPCRLIWEVHWGLWEYLCPCRPGIWPGATVLGQTELSKLDGADSETVAFEKQGTWCDCCMYMCPKQILTKRLE